MHLDLTSDSAANTTGDKPPGRPFLGIYFACCGVYSQIPLNREKTAYAGRCFRCLAQVEIKVGPDGSAARFFTAY